MQNEAPPNDEGIEVEYVAETLDYKDPVYAQFASIFETFKVTAFLYVKNLKVLCKFCESAKLNLSLQIF